jgi:hypothetical protein
MARTIIYVNLISWFTTTTTYLSTEREVANAKQLVKDTKDNKTLQVKVDYEIKTTKDLLTGKSHDKYVWFKKESVKRTIKEEIAIIANLIDRPQWLIADTKYIKDIKELSENDIVVFIIPPYIPWNKDLYETHSKAVSGFYKYLYTILGNINNVIVWKDSNNYIMTHNKQILIKTKNGKPGFMMETTALKSIYNSLTQKPIVVENAKKLLVDTRFLKNPYYQKLINVSKTSKNIYLMQLVDSYIHIKENKSVEHGLLKDVEKYNITWDVLDISIDPCLKTDVDKFIFKVYYIAYLRINNLAASYINIVRDEHRAKNIINIVEQVLKTELKMSDVYDANLIIHDGDYIQTDDSTIQLMDYNDPHKNYLEEEEASASPTLPIFEEDYEVDFNTIGGIQ